ncbi:MAG: ABC transporter substrate-binding protein [Verrucomicrobiae bacterium]|nr:ABC transporter substrate-binding protein [Verrucomicrobiae bacterium]
MKRRHGLLVCAVAMVALVVLLTWRRQASRETSPIRYAFLPIASDASFFVALERGFFAKEGLNVQATKCESSNQALEALVAGRVDATAVVALETALALEANTPNQFRVVEMTAATAETRVHRIEVKTDSPIKTLADLRGKKVGTFPGSQMVVFLKLILGRYFDADKEVEIIQLKPPLQPQALESGQVDALFCLEPTGTLLEEKKLARAISINPLYEYIQKPFPTAVGVVSIRMANEKPDVVRRINNALRVAHRFMREHPSEASAVFPKYAPIEATLAPRIAVYDYWDLTTIDRDSVQRLADLYAAKGIVTKQVSTASLYATLPK